MCIFHHDGLKRFFSAHKQIKKPIHRNWVKQLYSKITAKVSKEKVYQGSILIWISSSFLQIGLTVCIPWESLATETRSETTAVPEPVANARPSHCFYFCTVSHVFWRWHVSFSSNYPTAVPQPTMQGITTHSGSQRVFGKLSLGDLDNGACCCFGKNSSHRRFPTPVARRFFLRSDLFIIVFSELQNNEWGETETVLQAWGSQVILEFQINKGAFLDVWWNLPQNILTTPV